MPGVRRWLDDLGRDMRHSFRGLGRSPGLAATLLFVLALGIGANAAMFGIIHGMLIRPLPYPRRPSTAITAVVSSHRLSPAAVGVTSCCGCSAAPRALRYTRPGSGYGSGSSGATRSSASAFSSMTTVWEASREGASLGGRRCEPADSRRRGASGVEGAAVACRAAVASQEAAAGRRAGRGRDSDIYGAAKGKQGLADRRRRGPIPGWLARLPGGRV